MPLLDAVLHHVHAFASLASLRRLFPDPRVHPLLAAACFLKAHFDPGTMAHYNRIPPARWAEAALPPARLRKALDVYLALAKARALRAAPDEMTQQQVERLAEYYLLPHNELDCLAGERPALMFPMDDVY